MAFQLFRPGSHTASNGQTLRFSAAELRDAATAYDPEVHQAPLVVGHPRSDAPAYGWVKRLDYAEPAQMLTAEPDQVEPQFAELVRSGRLKYVSASFYTPTSPQNPKPGAYYLRHVGFLGAQPPSIKGLKPAEFSEATDGVITLQFGEADPNEPNVWKILADLIRRWREDVIVNRGLAVADTLFPNDQIQALLDEAAEEDAEEDALEPSSPFNYQETPMADPAPTDLEKALAAREAVLAAREKALADQEIARHRADCAAFAEGLTKEGRILPRDTQALAALLATQTGEPTAEFAEDGRPQDRATWLRGFLSRLPVQVDFSERSAQVPGREYVEFAAPGGYQIDPSGLAHHLRASAYQKAHPTTNYTDALAATMIGGM